MSLGSNVVEYFIRARDETKKTLTDASNNLKTFGKQGSQSLGGFADASAKTGVSVKDLSAIVNMSGGSMIGMAKGVATLGSSLMGLSAGPLALVVATFYAFYKATQWLINWSRSDGLKLLTLQTENLAVAAENSARAIDKINEAYDKLDKRRKSREGIEDLEQNITRDNDRAKLELARQRALGVWDSDQTLQRQEVNQQFDKMLAEMEHGYKNEDLEGKIKRIWDDYESKNERKGDLEERLKNTTAKATESLNEISKIQKKQQQSGLSKEQHNNLQKDIDTNQQTADKFTKQSQSLKKQIEDLKDEMTDMEDTVSALRGTSDTMYEAQKQRMANEAADLEEAYEKVIRQEEEARQRQLQKEEEERQRLLEKEEAARQRLEEKLSAERERLAQKEADAQFRRAIKDAQAEAKAAAEAQSAAQSRLAMAQSKVKEAWGWYRDKDSLQRQIDEEKANAAAEKQFDKEFAKLQRQRPDWMNAKNLSLDQEAVRRVAVAREEEKMAQKSLDKIAENTAAANELLENLLSMK